MKPTLNQYLDEARRYASHAFGYPGLIDDDEYEFERAYNRGDNVYEIVDEIGDNLDLDSRRLRRNMGHQPHDQIHQNSDL